MEQKKRASKGSGKVEFIANREQIEELLQKGYTMKSIHNLLLEEGKIIALGYKSLCHYVKYGVKLHQIVRTTEEYFSNKDNKKSFNADKKKSSVNIVFPKS